MANKRTKPDGCCLPNCFKCPLKDCVYDKIERCDNVATKKITLVAHYQQICLRGDKRALSDFLKRHPEFKSERRDLQDYFTY